ncbi:alpha/beta hydrolase [Bernardetia sp.]|uniref:alpha/beta hydrolase n=1 Tax=Bernardetia sp. TaxID=1937974 RepID=UPI0025C27103|nr:alpha/beta fold hydrolase [Bernardetia sp.]
MNIILQQLLKKPFFGNFFVQNWENPLPSIEQEQWKEINFLNPDGFILKGLFAPALTHEPKASILCVPPMLKSSKGYFLSSGIANFLRKNGYNVFLIDLNGFGESQNGSFDFPADVLAATKVLEELTPSLPLGYFGISQGAAWGICALANPTHSFETAIFEAPLTSLPEFWKHYPLAAKVLKVMQFIDPVTEKEKLRPINKISHLKNLKNILLMYGDKDIHTPIEMGKRFKDKANVDTELFIFENAAHLEPIKKYQGLYFEKVVNHFDTTFAPSNTIRSEEYYFDTELTY